LPLQEEVGAVICQPDEAENLSRFNWAGISGEMTDGRRGPPCAGAEPGPGRRLRRI